MALALAGGDAGSIVAVLADIMHVGHLTLGTGPCTISVFFIQNWPVSGWGLAMGVQSLPTCSSLQAIWQL